MAITSVGYPGTITDDNWRRMATATVGSMYGVDDYASWRVTAGVGDRATRIAAGGGFGLGVRDVSDGVVNLNHAPVPSGQRWDLIVAHRDWSTGTTTFSIIQGTDAKALPARASGFGTTNDQPIALARFAAGQTSVQEIIDLRCVPGDGGVVAFDELVRQYLDRVGTSIIINGVEWNRVINSTGSPVWISSDMNDTGWVSITPAPGWVSDTAYPLEVRSVGLLVEARGVGVPKTGPAAVSFIGTVPDMFRPSRNVFLGAYHAGYSVSGQHVGELLVDTAGKLVVPAYYWHGDLGFNTALPVHGHWFRG